MLKIHSLNAGYGKLRVLKNVSLHVNQGEIVGILGANGAGKTTLLNTIAGVVRAQAGSIDFCYVSLRGIAAHKTASRGLVLVPEGRQVFAPMSVEENLILGAYSQYKKNKNASVNNTMKQVYDLFPVLCNRKNQLAGTLSGGEQQMLAIGRALMAKPSFIMLDEPSMGIAPIIVKEIFATICEMRNNDCTILIVEQNSKAVLGIADRLCLKERQGN
jgi:branched-chain amino acid transport system ATP-binding protein